MRSRFSSKTTHINKSSGTGRESGVRRRHPQAAALDPCDDLSLIAEYDKERYHAGPVGDPREALWHAAARNMQRYMITGAAGNLARQLIEELDIRGGRRSAWIWCLPRRGTRQLDITDRSGPGAVARRVPAGVHRAHGVAAVDVVGSRPAARGRYATATVALMELAIEYSVRRFFFPSTSATHGGVLPDPLSETTRSGRTTSTGPPRWRLSGGNLLRLQPRPRLPVRAPADRGLAVRAPAAVSAYASNVFAAAARGDPFTFPVALTTRYR